jgi:hypothetical protein
MRQDYFDATSAQYFLSRSASAGGIPETAMRVRRMFIYAESEQSDGDHLDSVIAVDRFPQPKYRDASTAPSAVPRIVARLGVRQAAASG